MPSAACWHLLIALAAVRGDVLDCTSTTVVSEDHWEPKRVAYMYGICQTEAGTFYISAESAHLDSLMPGGKATLLVGVAVRTAENRLAKLTAERAGMPMPPYIRMPANLFEIVEVIRAPSRPKRQARDATDVRSVVTIRLVRNSVHVYIEGGLPAFLNKTPSTLRWG